MQKVEISICIVAYKAYDSLDRCLQSIYKNPPKKTYEVIVVDNNENKRKTKKILTNYKSIKAMYSIQNKGYGAGNNLGLSASSGKYCLILNPDVEVTAGAIDSLYHFMKNNLNCAIAGPILLSRNKVTPEQLAARRLTPITHIMNSTFVKKTPIYKFYESFTNGYAIRYSGINTKVDAVPGSAFMIRTSAFRSIGGFDEKFFLYFEEQDIGHRLQAAGWSLWILCNASVYHTWEGSSKNIKSQLTTKAFKSSRFYFFRKHYGIFNAYLVECFARFGKFEAIILLITVVGGFLRFFRLNENLVFHGELGDNYLAIKNILTSGIIPLNGPPTSHQWLSFGPYYYWLFTPVLFFVRYSPVGMAVIFAMLHTLLIPINYFFIKKLHSKKIALISSLLIAFSPAYVGFAHESRFFSLVLLLFYPFYYCFITKKYVLTGLFLAILFNFHLSPLLYVPALFLMLYKKKNMILYLTRLGVGFAIGFLPTFIYSAMNNFKMIKAFGLWIPYRIAGFLGIVPKNNFDSTVAQLNLNSILNFLTDLLLPLQWGTIARLISILTFLFTAFIFFKKRDFRNVKFLFLTFICGMISIFVHGDSPSHYYLPLYPILLLLISITLSNLRRQYSIFFILGLILFNSAFYFSPKWFYHQQDHYEPNFPVPYKLQLEATDTIIKDAQGSDFSLKRVGAYDEFEEEYSQNYKYLLWKSGNEPKSQSVLIYTIYENEYPARSEEVIYSNGGIIVTKKYEIDTNNA